MPHSGNDTIQVSWAISMGSARSSTSGGCPASTVTYPPATNQYEYSYCDAGTTLSAFALAYVVDLDNSSWYNSNTSYASLYSNLGWQNYTSCYNYGTPTCSNSTGSYGSPSSYGFNEVGAFALNGSSSLTMWANGTNMVRSHHYVLQLTLQVFAESYASVAHLARHWTATASASLNMATLGNGARLVSVVVS